MLDKILREAPSEFDQQFLEWVYELGDELLVNFVNLYYPADVERVQRHTEVIKQQIPEELKVYYEHVDPFSRLQDGWSLWYEREKKYWAVWSHVLVHKLQVTLDEAQRLVKTSPPLWPIDCFDRASDRVGFVWEGKLAVIDINLQSGRGWPLAIGLRNYFLQDVVVEILAERELEPVNFGRFRRHPVVLEVSGWPKEDPFPQHIALTVGKLLG